MTSVELRLVKEKSYPLVKPVTKKDKVKWLDEDSFKDVTFVRVMENGKDVIYGTYKSKRDSLKFGARLFKFVKSQKLDKVWVETSKLDGRFLSEGILLAAYEFDKYKKKKKDKKLVFNLMGVSKEELSVAKLYAEAVYFARDLENEPANVMTPQKFVETAKKQLRNIKKVKVKVLEYNELKKRGFGGIIAVGKGSENKPKLLIVEYMNGGKQKPIVLVGKGVCFDAGGINLKPTGYIEDMKLDMSGAAVVLATIWLAAKMGLKINLVGLMPLVENMPSGKATKPGDVIKMYDGTTVEVLNTDAEGRLILADSLAYASKKYKPSLMIDLATLTGAQIVALGYQIAAMLGTDKATMKELFATGKKVKEYVWPLPLPSFYTDLVKGEISDVKNISTLKPSPGTIVGGMFLKNFVGKTKWVHLDIAGPSIMPKAWEWMPKGGTGFGVRLLAEFLRKRAEK